jgi:hypothetical protein
MYSKNKLKKERDEERILPAALSESLMSRVSVRKVPKNVFFPTCFLACGTEISKTMAKTFDGNMILWKFIQQKRYKVRDDFNKVFLSQRHLESF